MTTDPLTRARAYLQGVLNCVRELPPSEDRTDFAEICRLADAILERWEGLPKAEEPDDY